MNFEDWSKTKEVEITIIIDAGDERILETSVTNSAADYKLTIEQIIEKLGLAERISIPDSLKEQHEYDTQE